MVTTVGIPPNVQSAILVRYERVKDTQREKRQHVRCYGLSRGLYEYNSAATANHRNSVAADWRYVRDKLTQQGFETRVVVKSLKQEGSGL